VDGDIVEGPIDQRDKLFDSMLRMIQCSNINVLYQQNKKSFRVRRDDRLQINTTVVYIAEASFPPSSFVHVARTLKTDVTFGGRN